MTVFIAQIYVPGRIESTNSDLPIRVTRQTIQIYKYIYQLFCSYSSNKICQFGTRRRNLRCVKLKKTNTFICVLKPYFYSSTVCPFFTRPSLFLRHTRINSSDLRTYWVILLGQYRKKFKLINLKRTGGVVNINKFSYNLKQSVLVKSRKMCSTFFTKISKNLEM